MKVNDQTERMNEFFQRADIKRHSVTVLEIGCGPVQPLAREFAEVFLKNDRYRCCLIRINPLKERTSQYKHEQTQFESIINNSRHLSTEGTFVIPEILKENQIPNFTAAD